MDPESLLDGSESGEQKALMCWCQQQGIENIFAIPNGGYRSKREAGKLKAEGVRAGVPDLFLAQPASGAAGLFIEMKRLKGGRTSDLQKQWLTRLAAAGYACVVATGYQEAKKLIQEYLCQ